MRSGKRGVLAPAVCGSVVAAGVLESVARVSTDSRGGEQAGCACGVFACSSAYLPASISICIFSDISKTPLTPAALAPASLRGTDGGGVANEHEEAEGSHVGDNAGDQLEGGGPGDDGSHPKRLP